MASNEMKLAMSASTLLNAIQFPVDVADLVLGSTTVDALIERGTFVRHYGSASTLPDVLSAPTVNDDSAGSFQLAANQVSRSVTSKTKFK